jgi:hypothetical protein
MKPQRCFETNKALEEAARRAERRKNEALARLVSALDALRETVKEER